MFTDNASDVVALPKFTVDGRFTKKLALKVLNSIATDEVGRGPAATGSPHNTPMWRMQGADTWQLDDDAGADKDKIDPEGVCRIREMEAAVQRLTRLGIKWRALEPICSALGKFEKALQRVRRMYTYAHRGAGSKCRSVRVLHCFHDWRVPPRDRFACSCVTLCSCACAVCVGCRVCVFSSVVR